MGKIIDLIKTINVDYLIKYARIIIIILAFQLIGPIISRVIIKIVHKITKSKKRVTDSGYYTPLKYFFYILGFYICIYHLGTTEGIRILANKVMKIMTIILLTKGTADSITPTCFIFTIINKERYESNGNEALNVFLSKVLRVIIYIIAIFIVISELGYGQNLNGLAAGLGIGSAAIALAAQDLVKSLLGGFSIITDKPFEIGDYIEIGVYSGTVIDITFRSTRIRAINNSIINIPNSLITTEYIINWNKLESRIIETNIRISLDSNTEKINRCISKINTILKVNNIVKEDSVQVHLESIMPDCNSIKIRAYVNVTEYNEFLTVRDKIYCDILNVLEMENIELVYPTQLVYTKSKE